MQALILLICFLLILLTLRQFQNIGWRGSFLFSALIWGLALTAITELLSQFGWLSIWPVTGAWGAIALFLSLLLIVVPGPNAKSCRTLDFALLSRFEISLLVLLFLMAMMIAVLAWMAPPNTWDSMTYHMSRVMHWIQNGSIAFYPTHIPRQLYQNPWSEFAILHFQLLSGGDRFANFVQWFSMIGSLIGVSLIAKELKATARGQIFAATFCATIPMGILESSSTQTDYVCSFWLVCFAYFGMLFKRKVGLTPALGTGISLGLSVLTKATSYIFALPFLVWFFLSLMKSCQEKKARYIFISVIIAFAINLGHYSRNYELYGSPMGPGREGALIFANEEINVSTITSNLVRNIGLHLGSQIEQSNVFLEKLIVSFHDVIGISPNDKRTTWTGTEFHISGTSFDENFAGNTIHFLLIVISIFLYVLRQTKDEDVNNYILSLLFAALLFSVIPKWQPWHSRLHLPLFVLWTPFIGLIFSNIRNCNIANVTIAALLVGCLPWLLQSTTKPVLPLATGIFARDRIDQYFTYHKPRKAPYLQAVEILSELKCANIGLIIGSDSWEYPLWILLRDKQLSDTVQLTHVNVQNISKQEYDKKHRNVAPCAVVAIETNTPSTFSIEDATYTRKWSSGSIAVFQQTTESSATPP